MENTQVETNSLDPSRPLTKREKRELAKQKKAQEATKQDLRLKIKKVVSILLLLIIIGFVGYKVLNWFKTPSANTSKENVLFVKDDDWVKGNPNAKVTLIEYADFECPACAIYSDEILGKLAADYGDNLKFVYRHFPLPQHTKAVDAAKAAEAAGKQGKFWEMGELLYKNQSDWSDGNLKDKLFSYAQNLGLNTDQFSQDLTSESIQKSIKDNESEAYLLKINETPTFYVNGKKANINNGYDDLKKSIDNALEASN